MSFPLFRRTRIGSPKFHIELLEHRQLLAVNLFEDINPGPNPGLALGFDSFANVEGTFFFDANDGTHGNELWKSNGTPTGTVMVKDLLPGSNGSFPSNLTNVSGLLFFTLNGNSGSPIWVSDGTSAHTFQIPGSPTAGGLINVDGKLLFTGTDSAHGSEVWVMTSDFPGFLFDEAGDATKFTFTRLTDDNPGSASSEPRNFTLTQSGEKMFFTSRNDTAGRRIWITDGTVAGTHAGADINTDVADGFDNTFPDFLATVGEVCYFRAYTPALGEELYKSDGTVGGTGLAADINPGTGTSSPEYLVNLNGNLLFQAFDPVARQELFKYSPITGTASVLKDIDLEPAGDGGTLGSFPEFLTVVNDVCYFDAYDGVTSSSELGKELYKTDGTTAGTVLLKDINPKVTQGLAEGSNPFNMQGRDGTLYFTADDGTNGNQLWMSDGTNGGTVMLSSINPGTGGISITSFEYVNEQLFLAFDDGVHGGELWSYKVPDADGDGLPDTWETKGIDFNMDGTPDLILPGANVNHKDAYIEVDYMNAADHNHKPLDAAINDVIAAFANAPLTNPDGNPGIAMHVSLTDEDAIPEVTPLTVVTRLAGVNNDFQDLKQLWFGTAAQRGASNSRDVLGAKRLAYRYSIFGHDHIHLIGSSGIADLRGDDFMVSLGSWDAADLASVGGQEAAEAGTFMHELGHTLGLLHGGGELTNYKPNYLSVMTYALQFPNFDAARPLDYSRQALSTLDENALDEVTTGIGGPAGRNFVYATNSGLSRVVKVEPANESNVDWNGDGILSESPVSADPNYFKGLNSPSPGQSLQGFNDWANIHLNYRDFYLSRDGVTAYGAEGTVPANADFEITDQQALIMAQLAKPPTNHSPTLSAISNVNVNEGTNVSFTAQASDPDVGDILTFSLGSGAPAGASINASTGKFSFTPPDGPATFNLTVKVTDNGSPQMSDSKTFQITVNNVAPRANAGADRTGTVGVPVTLNGTFVDPGIESHTFKWHVISSNGQTIPDGTNQSITFTPNAAGKYDATFTVTDKDGAAGSDHVAITVTVANTQTVTSFTLVNATTDKDIGTLSNGATIDLNAIGSPITIRANTNPATVGSVRFALDSNANFITENYAPYALFGDKAGDYAGGTLSAGSHTLIATPFTGTNATGTAGTPLKITFQVTAKPAVSSVTLVNTNTNQSFHTLVDNDVIDQSAVGNTMSVRAHTNPQTVGCVIFGLDGNPNYRTENFEPYDIFGDTNGFAIPGSFSVGKHTLTVTAFSGPNSTGVKGDPVVIHFQVIARPLVSAFFLINANTDQAVMQLTENSVVDLTKVGSSLNIRADTLPSLVGSVMFLLDNTTRIENFAPWAFFGDNAGDYASGILSLGQHTLKATPFSGTNGTGTAGDSLTIHFSVI